MKKKLLAVCVLSIISGSAFSYVLIGEGKVDEPQISGSPGFVVQEMPVPPEQIAQFEGDKKSEDDVRKLDGKHQ